MLHEGRKTLKGVSYPQDRLWEIKTPSGTFYLTDYNDEITGYTQELRDLEPDQIYYSGNAYYVTGKLAEKLGWTVNRINDRDH
jgi:hypothetical protein